MIVTNHNPSLALYYLNLNVNFRFQKEREKKDKGKNENDKNQDEDDDDDKDNQDEKSDDKEKDKDKDKRERVKITRKTFESTTKKRLNAKKSGKSERNQLDAVSIQSAFKFNIKIDSFIYQNKNYFSDLILSHF